MALNVSTGGFSSHIWDRKLTVEELTRKIKEVLAPIYGIERCLPQVPECPVSEF